MLKTEKEVTEKEIRKLADIYKKLNPENRKQTLLYAGLILTGQQNSIEKKAG